MNKTLAAIVIALLALFLFYKFGYPALNNDNGSEADEVHKNWIKFSPQTGKFKVHLPQLPTYAIDNVDIPHTDQKRWYEIYASEEINGTVYMINLITYQADYDVSDAKKLLHDVVNEAISSNPHNIPLDVQDGDFKDKKIVSFHFSNEPFEVKGQAFLFGNTVYLLTYTADKENFNEDDFEHFINSFVLVKEAHQKELKEEMKQEIKK